MLRTLGIDLAASAQRTAACVITWADGVASARIVEPPLSDDVVLELIGAADRIGIDCPLGWPVGFVEAITAHQAGARWPGRGQPDPELFRRTLTRRLTDDLLYADGFRPLSVSTDRIGVVALRCALLLDAIGGSVDRSGAGRISEVYPAAAMMRWGLERRGYKASRDLARPVLATLLDDLLGRAPWLMLDEPGRIACLASDHAFDALIAALVTRAVERGLTTAPTASQRHRAAVEGWIHVPYGDLARLIE